MRIIARYGYGVERLDGIQRERGRLQEAGANLVGKYDRARVALAGAVIGL